MAKVTINENTCKGCEPKGLSSGVCHKSRRVHRMCGVRYYVSRLCNNC